MPLTHIIVLMPHTSAPLTPPQELGASCGSFTIVAVKEGLNTDVSPQLQHVTGDDLTKQQLESLQTGKTVDNWPLLGVMLRELPKRNETTEKTPEQYISELQAARHRSRRGAVV
jgi:hypothetical protein